MIRVALFAGLAAGVFGFTQISAGELPEEKPVVDALNSALNAQFASDYVRLVSLIHPRTQHLFRDLLSARFDVLLRFYALNEIAAVSGLPAHPKDLSLTDSEFFVFTCNSVRARHPDFSDDSKYLPFTLNGLTFDQDRLAHLVLSYRGSVHTERTDFNFVRSFAVVLRHEQSQWLLWTCPLAERIGDIWCRDLMKGKTADQ